MWHMNVRRVLQEARPTAPTANDCSTHPWRRRNIGRKNPRLAAQGVDLQAAVVGQHPAAEMPGVAGGLQPGVGRKGVAVFRHLGRRQSWPASAIPRRPAGADPPIPALLRLAVPRTSMAGGGWWVTSGEWSSDGKRLTTLQPIIPFLQHSLHLVTRHRHPPPATHYSLLLSRADRTLGT